MHWNEVKITLLSLIGACYWFFRLPPFLGTMFLARSKLGRRSLLAGETLTLQAHWPGVKMSILSQSEAVSYLSVCLSFTGLCGGRYQMWWLEDNSHHLGASFSAGANWPQVKIALLSKSGACCELYVCLSFSGVQLQWLEGLFPPIASLSWEHNDLGRRWHFSVKDNLLLIFLSASVFLGLYLDNSSYCPGAYFSLTVPWSWMKMALLSNVLAHWQSFCLPKFLETVWLGGALLGFLKTLPLILLLLFPTLLWPGAKLLKWIKENCFLTLFIPQFYGTVFLNDPYSHIGALFHSGPLIWNENGSSEPYYTHCWSFSEWLEYPILYNLVSLSFGPHRPGVKNALLNQIGVQCQSSLTCISVVCIAERSLPSSRDLFPLRAYFPGLKMAILSQSGACHQCFCVLHFLGFVCLETRPLILVFPLPQAIITCQENGFSESKYTPLLVFLFAVVLWNCVTVIPLLLILVLLLPSGQIELGWNGSSVSK